MLLSTERLIQIESNHFLKRKKLKQSCQDLFESICRIVGMSTGHENELNKCDRAYSISVDDVSDRQHINHSNIIYTRSIHVHLPQEHTSTRAALSRSRTS